MAIAAIIPLAWIWIATRMVGVPIGFIPEDTKFSIGVVIFAASVVIPIAIIAFICGLKSRD